MNIEDCVATQSHASDNIMRNDAANTSIAAMVTTSIKQGKPLSELLAAD